MALVLTDDERRELERRSRSRKIRAEDAQRATVVLMLADGASFSTITSTLGCFSGLRHALETAIRNGSPRRPAGEISWPATDGPDAGDGGADLGKDAATAIRRQHALEHA
jgi:hypothetical protein